MRRQPIEEPARPGDALRVLEEGELELVGGSRTRKVDVRVVAATHRDLEAAARAGTFRADLYFRLSVIPLRVPPLRERGDDVVLLAESLVGKLARSLGRPVVPLDPSDVAVLRAYDWPGNVRELRPRALADPLTRRSPPPGACHG